MPQRPVGLDMKLLQPNVGLRKRTDFFMSQLHLLLETKLYFFKLSLFMAFLWDHIVANLLNFYPTLLLDFFNEQQYYHSRMRNCFKLHLVGLGC